MDFPQQTVAAIFPYYALPHPAMWRSALLKLRLLGCHAVIVPVPWAYHSPAQGYHDFSDIRDLPLLLNELEQMGMWVILNVGPRMYTTLSGAGIPGWLWREEAVSTNDGYSDSFLRNLDDWWQHLSIIIGQRDSLMGTILNPTLTNQTETVNAQLTQILVLAQNAGFTRPIGLWHSVNDGDLISWFEDDATAHVSTQWPVVKIGSANKSDEEDLLAELISTSQANPGGIVLNGVVPEYHWGWWYSPLAPLIPTSSQDVFLNQRQKCMQAEIALPLLKSGRVQDRVRAIAPGVDVKAWSTSLGTAIYLHNRRNRQHFPQIAIPQDNNTLITEEVQLLPDASKLLFANMVLRGGKLIYSTMDVVLRTEMAGRELLVLRNALGGEVRLSDDFRVRHSKGDVYVERLMLDDGKQLSVRFDPAKVCSLLLDAPDGPLQVLAVDTHLSERLWHLDDAWRMNAMPVSPWGLKPDNPARGIVLGPEYVVPDDKGGFSYLVKDRGYGYRWGPWKGSNPNTWLAPLIWRTPDPVRLPELKWKSIPGAPEVLLDYDDQHWRKIAPDANLDMESLDVDAGFVWYRGRFTGDCAYVDLMCNHAAEVFLNGRHIVSLNPAPDFSPPTMKRISLSRNLLRDENLLVVLVEGMGRIVSTDKVERYGLLHCALDAGQPIRWVYRPGLTGERKRQGVTGYADWAFLSDDPVGSDVVTWHYTRFALNIPSSAEVDLHLELVDVPVKTYIYLNGILIQRSIHKNNHAQLIHLPYALLENPGANELLIAQWARGAKPGMGSARLLAGDLLGWQKA